MTPGPIASDGITALTTCGNYQADFRISKTNNLGTATGSSNLNGWINDDANRNLKFRSD